MHGKKLIDALRKYLAVRIATHLSHPREISCFSVGSRSVTREQSCLSTQIGSSNSNIEFQRNIARVSCCRSEFVEILFFVMFCRCSIVFMPRRWNISIITANSQNRWPWRNSLNCVNCSRKCNRNHSPRVITKNQRCKPSETRVGGRQRSSFLVQTTPIPLSWSRICTFLINQVDSIAPLVRQHLWISARSDHGSLVDVLSSMYLVVYRRSLHLYCSIQSSLSWSLSIGTFLSYQWILSQRSFESGILSRWTRSWIEKLPENHRSLSGTFET